MHEWPALGLMFADATASMDAWFLSKTRARFRCSMDHTSQPSLRSVVRSAVVVEGGLVIVALALGWLLSESPLRKINVSLAGVAIGLLATLPMLAGLLVVDRFPLGPFKHLEDVMRGSILPLFRGASLVDLLLISLLAGLGEELLFRGVVQDYFQRVTGSPWMAVGIASLLFGLVHPITKAYAILAGLIGVYFGGLYLATGNLIVPIVAHAAYDFVALVYLLRAPDEKPIDAVVDEWLP